MIHFVFGAITVVMAYAFLRGLAKFLVSPAAADWMDRRAMLARAEADAMRAAQDQFRQTCERWDREAQG